MPDHKVYIIGVAPQGAASLLPEARRRVRRAEVLFGGKRLLEMFPASSARKVAIGHNLDEIVTLIKANLGQKRMAVLATGDPGFYGIARYLIEQLGRDTIEVIPNVSAVQMAFARIKESWDDAAVASIHGRPVDSIVDVVRAHRKVCILTDGRNGPGQTADVLLQHGVDNCRAYVCQDLGSDRESIIETDLYRLPGMVFSPLNVLVLIREPQGLESGPQLLGIPEEKFKLPTPGKLITKAEIRAVSLAKLALRESSIVWDIGAGSGAVSVEASLLARQGRVYAVEKNREYIPVIRENCRRFGRGNIEVVPAEAPDGLEALPDPDAVFVGGSGGRMPAILALACRRLRAGGRIVVNAATLESLQAASDELRQNGFTAETTLLNIARSKEIARFTRLEALNPVFIIAGWRQD